MPAAPVRSRLRSGLAGAVTLAVLLATPAHAVNDPEDCDETVSVFDPHDLVWDTDIPLDLGTVLDVEGIVDEYTEMIDDALEAEEAGLEPPDGVSSDELIDEGRWEVEDAIDFGRTMADCEEY